MHVLASHTGPRHAPCVDGRADSRLHDQHRPRRRTGWGRARRARWNALARQFWTPKYGRDPANIPEPTPAHAVGDGAAAARARGAGGGHVGGAVLTRGGPPRRRPPRASAERPSAVGGVRWCMRGTRVCAPLLCVTGSGPAFCTWRILGVLVSPHVACVVDGVDNV